MPESDPRILELRASPLFRHLPAADLTGIAAEVISRSLRTPSEQGAIAVKGKQITLLDPDALLDLAGN